MRSRDARGNVGGGFEVSIGGSGGSLVCDGGAGAAFGADCGAGAFAGAPCLLVGGVAGVGRCGPAPALGFCAAPFFCGFAFVAAGGRAVGG